jgi:RNA polymerase sigma-32 factor
VVEMEKRLSGQDMALEGQIEDGEESFAPVAYLAAPNAEPTEQLEALRHDRLQSTGLEAALQTLDERSRRIVQARWLEMQDEGEGGGATLHDLADEFGVSAERIRQIEAKALQKMKTALIEYA